MTKVEKSVGNKAIIVIPHWLISSWNACDNRLILSCWRHGPPVATGLHSIRRKSVSCWSSQSWDGSKSVKDEEEGRKLLLHSKRSFELTTEFGQTNKTFGWTRKIEIYFSKHFSLKNLLEFVLDKLCNCLMLYFWWEPIVYIDVYFPVTI